MSQVGSFNESTAPPDPSIAKIFETDNGNAIPVLNTIEIVGAENSGLATSGSGNTVSIDFEEDATNGQLLIGNTGNAPTFANLTSIGGTIVITEGPGTINLEAMVGGGVIQSITANSGTAIPIGGVVSIVGNSSNGITSTGFGNILTLDGIDASPTQKGVTFLATNIETEQGIDSTKTVVPSSLSSWNGGLDCSRWVA